MELLDKKHTRKFMLAMAEKHRPGWKFKRVSESALFQAEQALREWIIRQVKTLPSVGKTIKFG